jgi:hypothetical protein
MHLAMTLTMHKSVFIFLVQREYNLNAQYEKLPKFVLLVS